jgi:Raf kinase inhibitor-like YbhB/YbcL family protein
MKGTTSILRQLAGVLLVTLVAANFANPAFAQHSSPNGAFTLKSSTFTNGETLPLSMIDNQLSNGVNVCTPDGSMGGDQSPELSWSNAPARTKTFVVVAYDISAAFTHWGMYNIPASTTELPDNAGVAGSSYGMQVLNDFFAAEEYDGPCPPANVPPNNHRYAFTVYALDIDLHLPGSPDFLPVGETLYQALILAGQHDHILASAMLTGFYSSTPTK